ncbi:hypothetical protein ACR80R_10265 [Aquipuribacter sp. MA13-13]
MARRTLEPSLPPEVAMGRLLCLVGRHDWLRRRDTVVDGTGGVHQVCHRCGKERVRYRPPPPAGVVTHFAG